MSQSACRGCGAPIYWVKTRSGKSQPCDPGKISEWVTDLPVTLSARKVTLQDPDGDLHSGYLASVLAPDAREISGYVVHWATCPKAKEFRRGGSFR